MAVPALVITALWIRSGSGRRFPGRVQRSARPTLAAPAAACGSKRPGPVRRLGAAGPAGRLGAAGPGWAAGPAGRLGAIRAERARSDPARSRCRRVAPSMIWPPSGRIRHLL